MHTYIVDETLSIDLPASWEEITVGQFEELSKLKLNDPESKLLSIVTGLGEEVFHELDPDQVDEMIDVVSFVRDEKVSASNYEVPEQIELDGKVITTKIEPKTANFMQRHAFERRLWPELKENKGVINTGLSVALAIYLQPQITGKKFDDDSLDSTIQAVKKIPVLKGFPVAYFFTNACTRSLNKREKCLTNRLLQKVNEQQASTESQALESSTQ